VSSDVLGVLGQGRARRQRDLAGGDLLSRLQAGDGDLDVVRERGRVSLERQGHRLLVDEGVRTRGTGEVDSDLDGDLLALADGDQVDVLEVALDRVAYDGLRKRELVSLGGLERQQGVGVVPQRHHQVVAREGEVPGRVTVAVEDGRNLVGHPDPAGVALAELGTWLGDDADLGHGGTLLVLQAWSRELARWTTLPAPADCPEIRPDRRTGW